MDDNKEDEWKKKGTGVRLGKSITFYWPTNALHCIKFKG